jgi:transposase
MVNNPEIDLWCEDECHFCQHGTRCKMWIPPEDIDPIVLHAPTRKSIAVFGALRIKDGSLETMKSERFDAKTFNEFLIGLLARRKRGKIMVVVLDNARWHHAKVLEPWLTKHQEKLLLDFLPPYSPELNAIERAWKLTRILCTHNRHFETLEELENTIQDKFDEWSIPNDNLRRLCAIN